MLKVITCNLNGIRAASRKGFFNWVKDQNADVVCVQEIKAQSPVLSHDSFRLLDYFNYFYPAEKKGYSGVGIYSKQKPINILYGINWQKCDMEGRYLEIQFNNLHIVSTYFPSGTMGETRQQFKYEFLEKFLLHLKAILQTNPAKEYIICGDLNIAHKEIDLKNWRSNQKNSGFLPRERQWLDTVFDDIGLVDAFRHLNQEKEEYTWWSNRGQAYAKNVGWRIDYQIISPNLKNALQSTYIYKDQRFSDHAPLVITYNFILQ